MSENKVEEVTEVEEETKKTEKKPSNILGRSILFLSPITERTRDIVLGFGELIVTVSVLIGLITAIIGGFSDILNVGVFAGISNMFTDMVNVIMGALVIFLLFAIYRNGQKPIKNNN